MKHLLSRTHLPRIKAFTFTHKGSDPEVLDIVVYASNAQAAAHKLKVPAGRKKEDYKLKPDETVKEEKEKTVQTLS